MTKEERIEQLKYLVDVMIGTTSGDLGTEGLSIIEDQEAEIKKLKENLESATKLIENIKRVTLKDDPETRNDGIVWKIDEFLEQLNKQ